MSTSWRAITLIFGGNSQLLRALGGIARWRIWKAAFPSPLLRGRALLSRPFRGGGVGGSVQALASPEFAGERLLPRLCWEIPRKSCFSLILWPQRSRPRWLVEPCGAAVRREPPQGAVGTCRGPGVTDGALEAAEFSSEQKLALRTRHGVGRCCGEAAHPVRGCGSEKPPFPGSCRDAACCCCPLPGRCWPVEPLCAAEPPCGRLPPECGRSEACVFPLEEGSGQLLRHCAGVGCSVVSRCGPGHLTAQNPGTRIPAVPAPCRAAGCPLRVWESFLFSHRAGCPCWAGGLPGSGTSWSQGPGTHLRLPEAFRPALHVRPSCLCLFVEDGDGSLWGRKSLSGNSSLHSEKQTWGNISS